MPWQPFTPDSGQRKSLRTDSPDSLASKPDSHRRRPSYMEEFDVQVPQSVNLQEFLVMLNV